MHPKPAIRMASALLRRVATGPARARGPLALARPGSQLHRPRPSFPACNAIEPSGYSSDDLLERQALGEALELFEQANQLSKLQVHAEMEQAFAADSTESSEADGSSSSSPPGAMLNFWVEQGLSADTASALLQELQARGRTYTMNQVSAKVQRLRRLLPDADIASWALRDSRLLDITDMNTALLNMICLVEAFPGRDIVMLLARQPRLLWCEDLRERVSRVFHKLQDLHPSKDEAVVSIERSLGDA